MTNQEGMMSGPRGQRAASMAVGVAIVLILSSHHHDKIDSLTRARSTALAASYVEMYMRSHNGIMPAPPRSAEVT
jgi:hypothetical protein